MLANEYFPRGELAVGAGWHRTAARLLDEQPAGRAPALHAWTHAQLALIERDSEGAPADSEQMTEIGDRVEDLDLALLGRARQ
jgi:hypothetical protein